MTDLATEFEELRPRGTRQELVIPNPGNGPGDSANGLD